MMYILKYSIFIGIWFFYGGVTLSGPQSREYQEIPRSIEEIVNFRLESIYGRVVIARGSSDLILSAIPQPPSEVILGLALDYEVHDLTGRLNVSLTTPESGGRPLRLRPGDTGEWKLLLCDDLPVNVDVELGAGSGSFDFSGIILNRLNISTGASRVDIKFAEPNRGRIENMKIEAGVSRFEGRGLGFANFGNLNFEGGIGAYTLDFSGNLSHEANVGIVLVMGSVNVIIPPEVGVKLTAKQKWFTSLDVPSDFEQVERNQYVSQNYKTSEGKLNINIDAGIGSIRITR